MLSRGALRFLSTSSLDAQHRADHRSGDHAATRRPFRWISPTPADLDRHGSGPAYSLVVIGRRPRDRGRVPRRRSAPGRHTAFAFYAPNITCGEGGALTPTRRMGGCIGTWRFTPQPRMPEAYSAELSACHHLSRPQVQHVQSPGPWCTRRCRRSTRSMSACRAQVATRCRTPRSAGVGFPREARVTRVPSVPISFEPGAPADATSDARIRVERASAHFLAVPLHPYYADTFGSGL